MKDAESPLLDKDVPESSTRRKVFFMLEMTDESGRGRWFLALSFGITILAFVVFALNHEPGWQDPETLGFLKQIEMVSVLFFTFEYLLRLWTCVELCEDVDSMVPGALVATRICWSITNLFAVIDLVSIVPFYVNWLTHGFYLNLQWIRVVRVLRIMPSIPYYQVYTKSAPLLFAGGFAGFTVWLICACLYYMFERHNPLMEYSPAGDDAGPDDPHWNNFHCIPSAMYYSLLNFFGEFPLIDQHSTGGRFIGMFIQVIGAAVMAIPAGALGNAFSDVIDDAEDDDDEGDGDGEGNDAEQASGDAAPPPEVSILSEWLECLDGENGLKIMPFSRPLGGLDAGVFLPFFVNFLSICSALHFTLLSLTDFPGNLATTIQYLNVIGVLASCVLLLEWLFRVYMASKGGSLVAYQFSTLGIIDFLAALPILQLLFPSSIWIKASLACRILKPERFVGAFKSFWQIICKQSKAFVVTGTFSLVCWLIFSTLMYYAERHNPDPDMQRYYSSVFTSMWVTLLNLTGECPLAQYTVTGKFITAIMGLFGVGFVSIPMGLLGGGFQEKVEDLDDDEDDKAKEEAGDADLVASAPATDGATEDEGEMTKRQKIFKFLQGSGANEIDDLNEWEACAVYFERFVIFMIFASAVVATLEANGGSQKDADDPWYKSLFELFVVLLFSFEYCLRYYAAPENPRWKEDGYVSDQACRFAFLTSWPSMLDLLAITPYYFSMMGSSLADQYDGQLRMLRVFRLLTLDKYVPSVSLIGRVIKNSAEQFKMAGYAMVSLWLIFATLLWICERHDTFKIDHLRQDQRYASVISALPYTLVHLTGDYPLIDYTLQAKIVLFFALLFAVGVVSVPAGLLAAGFMRELRALHEEERKMRSKQLNKVQTLLKGWIVRWRMRRLVKSAQAEETSLRAAEKRGHNLQNPQFRAWKFLTGESPAGKKWSKFMMLLIATNVLAVILESVQSIEKAVGKPILDLFELVSVLIFTATYIGNVWVASLDRKFKCNRYNYIVSFWGIVDFITVAPYWLQCTLNIFETIGVPVPSAIAEHAFIFRVFRVLRILQAEDYVESFTLLDDAWYECRSSMIACGFMALMVWVSGSVLFYNFEQGNPRMEGAFDTLPSSMYYAMIFLGGEWGLIDFTPAGQVVCVFYCVVGIALYGIPVGALFDAFSSVLEDRNEAEENAEAEKES